MEQKTIHSRLEIQHVEKDGDKRLIFGWAYVCKSAAGETMIDHSGEIIDVEEIEQAAYRYVKFWRDGSDNHERGGVAVLIESMVFTDEKIEALGIPPEAVPRGWWVGFQVLDDAVWEKVKSGEYRMFSIEGSAVKIPVPQPELL